MRTKALFFWPQMKDEVVKLVRSCNICIQAKGEHGPYPGLLQPLKVPNQAWTHVSMDFVEGLPKSKRKNVILVIIVRFSNYGHFIGLSLPYSADTVDRVFLYGIYKLHGLPVSIVTDRYLVFTSLFWRELFKLMGTSLDMSSAYHPKFDGQTERLNQCLENYLRCIVHDHPYE